jgi:glutathione S-transferase
LIGNAPTLADIAVYAQLFAIRDSTVGAAEIVNRGDVAAFMDRVDGATRPVPASRAA